MEYFEKTFILNDKFINVHAQRDQKSNNYFVTIDTVSPCGTKTTVTKKYSLERLNRQLHKLDTTDTGHSFSSLLQIQKNPEIYAKYCRK